MTQVRARSVSGEDLGPRTSRKRGPIEPAAARVSRALQVLETSLDSREVRGLPNLGWFSRGQLWASEAWASSVSVGRCVAVAGSSAACAACT